jgi:tRNA(Arg) A34 adenosine deaminase TadA
VAISDDDRELLQRAVALARTALDAGDEPFGSILVGGDGSILFEDRNRIKEGVHGGDATRHPEFAIARWAAEHLTPDQRAVATVYTSGEHCPMCSAAHAWVGLGRIVYVASSAQLSGWLAEWGVAPGPVAALPVAAIAPGIAVDGPEPGLGEQVKALYEAAFRP